MEVFRYSIKARVWWIVCLSLISSALPRFARELPSLVRNLGTFVMYLFISQFRWDFDNALSRRFLPKPVFFLLMVFFRQYFLKSFTLINPHIAPYWVCYISVLCLFFFFFCFCFFCCCFFLFFFFCFLSGFARQIQVTAISYLWHGGFLWYQLQTWIDYASFFFCVLTLDYVMSSLEFLYFVLPMKFVDFPNMNLWYWFPFLWLLVMGQCLFVQWLVLVWICRFPLPLGVWEGLRLVIVALPGLFSYLFFFFFFFFFDLSLYFFFFFLK